MAVATLSSKNQIVIPREAREALGLRPGDKLLIVVRGDHMILQKKPRSWHAAISGPGARCVLARLPDEGAPELGLSALRRVTIDNWAQLQETFGGS